MQKKIIALAIAGLMSGAAFAQSNVEIYGRLHLSVDASNNDNLANDRTTSLASNASRIGFRGTEALGNGMSAIWGYEFGVDAGSDTAAAGWQNQRDMFLGLKGNWGTFQAGRMSWMNTFHHDYNLFTDQVGDAANFTGNGDANGLKAGSRKNNLLRYTSPSFNGLTVMVQAAPDDDSTDDSDASYQGKISYVNGPISVAASYAREGNRTDHATTGTEHVKVSSLGGSYDFGAVKVGGMWWRVTDAQGVDGRDRNSWLLNAAWKVTGNGTIKAQYVRAGKLDNVAQSKSNMWTLGYDHALSKRTTAYVAYARVNNDAAAAFDAQGGGNSGHGADGGATAAGRDPRVFSIGLSHNF